MAYFSRKMIDAKRNYEIHDTELLAIVEGFCVRPLLVPELPVKSDGIY